MSGLGSHPNVLELLGACVAPPRLALVTPFCQRGSLYGLLHSRKDLLWRVRAGMCLDAARGVAFLHMIGMLHRDLKSGEQLAVRSGFSMRVVQISEPVVNGNLPLNHRIQECVPCLLAGNLLVDTQYNVKVADFGLSKLAKAVEAPVPGGLGTYQWMAPEVMEYGTYSEKTDVFSFGIILYECITRKLPFEGERYFPGFHHVEAQDVSLG